MLKIFAYIMKFIVMSVSVVIVILGCIITFPFYLISKLLWKWFGIDLLDEHDD